MSESWISEKEAVVERYMSTQSSSFLDVVVSVSENPSLVHGAIAQKQGPEANRRAYMLGLYAKGVPPIDIQRQMKAVKETAQSGPEGMWNTARIGHILQNGGAEVSTKGLTITSEIPLPAGKTIPIRRRS